MILAALLLAEVAALVLAVMLARKARHPLVLLLAFALVNEVAIALIHLYLTGATKPFAGLHRLAYHIETALVLGWPCAIAAVVWQAFAAPHPLRRLATRPKVQRRLLTAWAAVLSCFIVLYPLPRGWTRPLLTVWQVAMIALCVRWIWRGWGRQWTQVGILVGALVTVEGVLSILGPWGADLFADWERLSRVPYLLTFGAVAAVELWWVVRSGRAQ